MKSIRITFRLQPYQLARGLQTIRQLEPSYKLLSLNDIVKTIYHDYLAKMSLNRNDSAPPELIEEIISFIGKSSTEKSLSLDDLMNIKPKQASENLSAMKEPEEDLSAMKEPEQEPEPSDDITDKILAEINALSTSTTASKSKSEISSVTDFSPPKDWKE